jgi:transcriptional regulator with XRE-family HTH domain
MSYAENLRVLCSSKSSVSEVCRRLKINRQQFARYLNGEVAPSARNVRKICDFFGMEPDDLLLPTPQFKTLVSAQPQTATTAHFELPLSSNFDTAQLYAGYYRRYNLSTAYPGGILVSMIRVATHGQKLLTKAIERLKPFGSRMKRSETFKYYGHFVVLHDRIFIIETEYLQQDSIEETVLYPTDQHPCKLLFGKCLGLSTGATREPYLSPMVYEYHGKQPNISNLMRQCGLLRADSPLLSPIIRDYLYDNTTNSRGNCPNT